MDIRDKERLLGLKSRMEKNARFSRLLADYLNLYPTFIDKESMDILLCGADFSEKDAIIALLSEAFSLDYKNPLDREIIRDYLSASIKVLNAQEYYENPYYKNVSL